MSPQEDSVDDEFTEEQYGLGWAALLWFSQMMPERAIDWIVDASRNGNRMARMFGFKFIGSRMYRQTGERSLVQEMGLSSTTLIGFMLTVVILLGLLLAFVVYLGMNGFQNPAFP